MIKILFSPTEPSSVFCFEFGYWSLFVSWLLVFSYFNYKITKLEILLNLKSRFVAFFWLGVSYLLLYIVFRHTILPLWISYFVHLLPCARLSWPAFGRRRVSAAFFPSSGFLMPQKSKEVWKLNLLASPALLIVIFLLNIA